MATIVPAPNSEVVNKSTKQEVSLNDLAKSLADMLERFDAAIVTVESLSAKVDSLVAQCEGFDKCINCLNSRLDSAQDYCEAVCRDARKTSARLDKIATAASTAPDEKKTKRNGASFCCGGYY